METRGVVINNVPEAPETESKNGAQTILPPNHPLAAFSGVFKNHPLEGLWWEEVVAFRAEADKAERERLAKQLAHTAFWR